MICCNHGCRELALTLIELGGVNIHEKNIFGDTPVKLAQNSGFEELSLLLITKYGASIKPMGSLVSKKEKKFK